MNGDGAAIEMDAATASSVEHLAQMWGVSKMEVIRRAVAQVDANSPVGKEKPSRLEAFKDLKRRLALTPAKADEWQNCIRQGRR